MALSLRLLPGVVLALAAALAACGEGEEPSLTPTFSPAATPTATSTPASTTPSPTPGETGHYHPGIAVFSDSILLWSRVVDQRVAPHYESTFFLFVASLFGEALKLELPLRVGIAFGDCVIQQERSLYLGAPIVNAYLTEEAQDWIGVACHPSCFAAPGSESLEVLGTLVRYPIPLKDSKAISDEPQHTVDWPFWSQGARSRDMVVDLDLLLSKELAEQRGTEFEARWARTLEYYRSRIAVWDKRFQAPFPALASPRGNLPPSTGHHALGKIKSPAQLPNGQEQEISRLD